MTKEFTSSFRDCIARLNEVISLIGEDEQTASLCLEGFPLQDYRDVTRREVRILEDVKGSLRRGC